MRVRILTLSHIGSNEAAEKKTKNKMKTTSSNEIEITARAKAFSGEGVKTHKFLVRGNEVTVWDPVAGHYTTCHSMSPATVRRVAKLAAKS